MFLEGILLLLFGVYCLDYILKMLIFVKDCPNSSEYILMLFFLQLFLQAPSLAHWKS